MGGDANKILKRRLAFPLNNTEQTYLSPVQIKSTGGCTSKPGNINEDADLDDSGAATKCATFVTQATCVGKGCDWAVEKAIGFKSYKGACQIVTQRLHDAFPDIPIMKATGNGSASTNEIPCPAGKTLLVGSAAGTTALTDTLWADVKLCGAIFDHDTCIKKDTTTTWMDEVGCHLALNSTNDFKTKCMW